MFALVPHRDTQLLLAKAQKELLARFNARFAGSPLAVPSFPFWALSGSPFDFDGVVSAEILAPRLIGGVFAFPLKFFSEGARSAGGTEIRAASIYRYDASSHYAEKIRAFACDVSCVPFPIKLRVFKTGTAVFENNGWQLFDEDWVKLR